MKPYSKWQNYHRFMNSFIRDAIDADHMTRNPYRWLNIDKEISRGGIGKYLTKEEFEKLRQVRLPTTSDSEGSGRGLDVTLGSSFAFLNHDQ